MKTILSVVGTIGILLTGFSIGEFFIGFHNHDAFALCICIMSFGLGKTLVRDCAKGIEKLDKEDGDEI